MHYYVKSVIPVIESRYDSLTPVEKTIADFFLGNEKEEDFSAKAVSEKLFVSRASLSRFAKKLGFRGYKEFVYQYEEGFVSGNENITNNTKRVLNTYQALLNKVYSLVDEAQIERLVEALSEDRRVLVCGCGSSALAAKEMELRFMRIGVRVDSVVETDLMRMSTVFQNAESLVFGFSVSGEQEEVLYVLRESHKRGATTVLFTMNHRKEMSAYCSEVVLLPSIAQLNYGNVISPQFPVLVMLDIIYAYYMKQNKDERECLYDSTLEALRKKEDDSF